MLIKLLCHKSSIFNLLMQLNDLAVSLRDIPEPAEDQITALTIAVEKVYEEHGINKNEREQRADVTFRLEKILKEKIPGRLKILV